MNFKPNAWTLLFALSLGALLFNMYGSNTENTEPTPEDEMAKTIPLLPLDTCPLTELPMADFYNDYARYLDFADSLKTLFTEGAKDCPSFANLFNKYNKLVNPNVRSFKIPKCEMREMLALNPDGEYYAYLIMKEPKDRIDTMVIDLAFSHEYYPGDNSSSFNSDKILASKGVKVNKDGVFDFTLPCPDSCDE